MSWRNCLRMVSVTKNDFLQHFDACNIRVRQNVTSSLNISQTSQDVHIYSYFAKLNIFCIIWLHSLQTHECVFEFWTKNCLFCHFYCFATFARQNLMSYFVYFLLNQSSKLFWTYFTRHNFISIVISERCNIYVQSLRTEIPSITAISKNNQQRDTHI